MMNILERYIAKTILSATGLVGLIMTSVLFLMSMLGELKNIGEGDYGLIQALTYVLLRLPNAVYQFSPLIVLLGSIIGLSILTSHRELAVMRTSGFSIRRIVYGVFLAALVLILMISLMGEWLGPGLGKKAELHREIARNQGQSVVTASGVWFHVENNFIHVQAVVGRQFLQGVTRYQFNADNRLEAAYYAKTLSFKNDQWTMHDVVKTTFFSERTKSQLYPTLLWEVKFNPNLLNVGLVNPNELPLPKLIKFIRYLKDNGLQAGEYQYTYWQRLLQPFASLIMILLAIPFVLGALSTSALGLRILIGIMTGFAFFILNAFLGQLSIVYQLPAIVAAAMSPLVFLGLGILLFRRLVVR